MPKPTDIAAIEANVEWILEKLEDIRRQAEMLMDYLDRREDVDNSRAAEDH